MSAGEIKANVILKQRSLLGTLAKLPSMWRGHYRLLRSGNGRIMSAYIAWRLTRSLVTTRGREHICEC
jgi:hypothetical protein